MSNKPLACLILAAALGQTAAVAEEAIAISTGREGGGYHGIGTRLKEVLAEQGVAAEVVTSAGSTQNLNALNDPGSPVSVGLTQADALGFFLKSNPDFEGKYLILSEIGKECVFIVSAEDSAIADDGDLQDKGEQQISVQDPNSGVAVTWNYMTQLEPKLKNTQAVFTDTMETLAAIKAEGKNSKKTAMLVQRPTAKSPAMQVVLENPKAFRFISVTDWDLNDKLPDGRAVYSFDEVTVQEKSWGFDKSVDTICTQGLMLAARDKLTPDQRSRLANVMLLAADRVLQDKP